MNSICSICLLAMGRFRLNSFPAQPHKETRVCVQFVSVVLVCVRSVNIHKLPSVFVTVLSFSLNN